MEFWLADPPLFSGPGQGGRQIVDCSCILQLCDRHRWQLAELAADRPQDDAADSGLIGVVMTLSGGGFLKAPAVLAQVDGVTGLRRLDEDAE